MVTFAETRLKEIVAETMLIAALKNGAVDSTDLRLEIELLAREREKEFLTAVRMRGIAAPIRGLLSAKRKKDVDEVARSMVLESEAFHDLALNSRVLGLSHHSVHHEWLPEARELSDGDREQLFAGDLSQPSREERPHQVAGKVRQMFEEREHRSVHMFTSSDGRRWHCFFMSFRDIGGAPLTGQHHWKHGGHMHFVNYLFSAQLTRAKVLQGLSERHHSVKNIHIRYQTPRRAPDTGERLYVDSTTGRHAKVPVR